MFGRRLLILVPHPDDEVVGCGALIGRARAVGANVFTLVLTSGVPPRERLWPWQRRSYDARVARRGAEFDAVADRLGVIDSGRIAIPCRTLKDHLAEARARIAEAIDTIRPDMLWTPAFEGGHQDHDSANFLASLMRGQVDVWEFSEYAYWDGRTQNNRFAAPIDGTIEFALTEEERRHKRALLAIYASERANLRHIRVARESIRPMPIHDYARPPLDSPLFYQRFQWVPAHPRVDRCRPEDVARAIGRFADGLAVGEAG